MPPKPPELNTTPHRKMSFRALPRNAFLPSGMLSMLDYLISHRTRLSGALIPECNDLSQFIEDTGGLSIPVPEFNLIARPLNQSS